MYLNCKTCYSLRYGTIATEELVKKALESGTTAIALTNINTTADAWDFVKYCNEYGIKPIVGAEIRNDDTPLYLLIACNNKGFAWIHQFLSDHLLEKKLFPEKTIDEPFFTDLWDGYVIYPLGNKAPEKLFGNEFIGVLPTEVNKLFSLHKDLLRQKFVVRQPVTFQSKGHYTLHKLLRAIDKNVLLSKLASDSTCSPDETFVSPSDIIEKFKQYPFIITNTYRLMDNCSIDMEYGKDKTKKLFSASAEDDRILLSKLAHDGLIMRYGKKNKEAKKQVDKELAIINKLGFNAYFLITWDIIRYAKSKGYFHIGRGSGANSIVAYCLQITDVDPIELNLYFERFINPHRSTPPDFDIDFSWTDRDDVFDYIFKRYGKDHVGRLGMFTSFQYKAVIWELGKVYGLPEKERKELRDNGQLNPFDRTQNAQQRGQEDQIAQRILYYGKYLVDMPDTMSVHTGGIIISEEPLYSYTAIYMPESGFRSTQIDMFIAEDIGLYKLDVLSQRGLGHIKMCIELVKKNRGIDVDIFALPKFKKDERIKEHLRTGNTIGCFYGESPAIRHVFKKLNCDSYEMMVAASSIIRPGVGSSGMMDEFIQRHNNPGQYKSLHPLLAQILKETYEVMIYQENMIQVAVEWAKMTPEDADLLRRATSFKNRIKGALQTLKNTFFANCAAQDYPIDVVTEVWRQISSFTAFSFCKAHAASYANETYQSLHLKVYYPLEFMVAVINNFGGFYSASSRELYYYELMKAGAKVFPPCVNNSDYLTNIRGDVVHIGFVQIKGLEKELAEQIIEERNHFGPYTHLQDFIERSNIKSEQLRLLIKAGAFRFTNKTKPELFLQSDFIVSKMKNHIPGKLSLFKTTSQHFTLPSFEISVLDDVYDQVQLLGFPVCNPFVLVDDDPARYTSAAELKNNVDKTVTVLGYHITHKQLRTKTNKNMGFGAFIDARLDWIDTVHFPAVFSKLPLTGGFYRITGKVAEKFRVTSINVEEVNKAGIKPRDTEEAA